MRSEILKIYINLDSENRAAIDACKRKQQHLIDEYDNLRRKCKRLEKLWYFDSEEMQMIKREFETVYEEIDSAIFSLQQFNFL